MSRPQRVLSNSATAAAIIERFSKSERFLGASYATVRDYCESRDELPQITAIDGDLKNVQRPWAVKAILANLRPPARLLEIGGGEPIASGFLSELGYDVTLVDPYDGFGNGPVDYQGYVERFPHVKIVREYFRPGMTALASRSRSSFGRKGSPSIVSISSCKGAASWMIYPSPNASSPNKPGWPENRARPRSRVCSNSFGEMSKHFSFRRRAIIIGAGASPMGTFRIAKWSRCKRWPIGRSERSGRAALAVSRFRWRFQRSNLSALAPRR